MMQEKLNLDTPMKGHYAVELVDQNGKRTVIETDNAIGADLSTILKQHMLHLLFGKTLHKNKLGMFVPTTHNPASFGHLLALDTATALLAGSLAVPGQLIGYASPAPYAGAEPKQGTINLGESFIDASKVRLVYDFSTDKANGTFQTLALSDPTRARALKNNIAIPGVSNILGVVPDPNNPNGVYIHGYVSPPYVTTGDYYYVKFDIVTQVAKYGTTPVSTSWVPLAVVNIDGVVKSLASNNNNMYLLPIDQTTLGLGASQYWTPSVYYTGGYKTHKGKEVIYERSGTVYHTVFDGAGSHVTNSRPVGAETTIFSSRYLERWALPDGSVGITTNYLGCSTVGASSLVRSQVSFDDLKAFVLNGTPIPQEVTVPARHNDSLYLNSKHYYMVSGQFNVGGLDVNTYGNMYSVAGLCEGASNYLSCALLPSPVVKNNTQTMKITYTFNY